MSKERMQRRQRRVRASIQLSIEQQAERSMEWWRDSVPERYRGMTVENDLFGERWGGLMNRGQLRKMRQYLENPVPFLLMRGPKGVGKSTLACTLVDHLMEQKMVKSAEYASVNTLLNQFSFGQDEDPIRRVSSVEMLVLDDVGASNEGITAHQKRSLWSVIDNRWARNKLTIVTTNMSIASNSEGIGLVDWFGESAWDRIQDQMILLEINGQSLRGQLNE